MNIRSDDKEGPDEAEMKVKIPKKMHDLLHKNRTLKNVTISEQVRRAIIELYSLNGDKYPPVVREEYRTDLLTEEQHNNFKEKNMFDEPVECEHGCGFDSKWRSALKSHERHYCPKRPDEKNKTQDELRREKESTRMCHKCEEFFHLTSTGRLRPHKDRKTGEYPCDGSGDVPVPPSHDCPICGTETYTSHGALREHLQEGHCLDQEEPDAPIRAHP